jgi:hypothetical protein
MGENHGLPGWGLGIRPAVVPRINVLATKYQVGITRWIFKSRPLQRPRAMNKKATNVNDWKELALNRRACNDLSKKAKTHNGL